MKAHILKKMQHILKSKKSYSDEVKLSNTEKGEKESWRGRHAPDCKDDVWQGQ